MARPSRKSSPPASATVKASAPARATAHTNGGAAKGSPLLGPLDLVTLHVTDLERALRFYGEVLELPLARRAEDLPWAQFQAGTVTLGIHAGVEPGGRPPGGATGFTFLVQDAAKAVEELRKRGVTITAEAEAQPWGVTAEFRDPDGNEFVLFQRPAP
jgi:predicted enzyme related to lactoylglutathione lyase